MSQTARPSRSRASRRSRSKNSDRPLVNGRPAWADAADALAPLLSDGKGDEEFRVNRIRYNKPEVAPGSYTPRYRSSRPHSTGFSFGGAERFNRKKHGFISKYHQSDNLCTASPGPTAYNPTGFPDKPRAATQFWGSLTENADKRDRKLMDVDPGAMVGPAAYEPNHAAIQPTAPRATMGLSYFWQQTERKRKEEKLVQEAEQEAFQEGLGDPEASEQLRDKHQWKNTLPAAPGHSFAPPPEIRGRPERLERTSFLTQDHRGIRMNIATHGLGPDTYRPRTRMTHKQAANWKLGTAKRFSKAGDKPPQYISAEHCKANFGLHSPGPMVYHHHTRDMAYTGGRASRPSGLNKWIP